VPAQQAFVPYTQSFNVYLVRKYTAIFYNAAVPGAVAVVSSKFNKVTKDPA
jgi:hypothetical protein